MSIANAAGNIATTVGNDLTKLDNILALLPQINQIVLNSLAQIDAVLPQAGFNTAKVQAVTNLVADALKAGQQTLVAVEDILPLITNFATGILAIVDQVKSIGAAPATPTKP